MFVTSLQMIRWLYTVCVCLSLFLVPKIKAKKKVDESKTMREHVSSYVSIPSKLIEAPVSISKLFTFVYN